MGDAEHFRHDGHQGFHARRAVGGDETLVEFLEYGVVHDGRHGEGEEHGADVGVTAMADAVLNPLITAGFGNGIETSPRDDSLAMGKTGRIADLARQTGGRPRSDAGYAIQQLD